MQAPSGRPASEKYSAKTSFSTRLPFSGFILHFQTVRAWVSAYQKVSPSSANAIPLPTPRGPAILRTGLVPSQQNRFPCFSPGMLGSAIEDSQSLPPRSTLESLIRTFSLSLGSTWTRNSCNPSSKLKRCSPRSWAITSPPSSQSASIPGLPGTSAESVFSFEGSWRRICRALMSTQYSRFSRSSQTGHSPSWLGRWWMISKSIFSASLGMILEGLELCFCDDGL